jgi:hypothetical protein
MHSQGIACATSFCLGLAEGQKQECFQLTQKIVSSMKI